MKFGARLEADLVPDFKPHYLQYKLLKKEIKSLEGKPNAAAGDQEDSGNGLLANAQITYQEFAFPGPKAHRYSILSTFKPLLDAELAKVNDFVVSKVKELENRIMLLLRTSAPWKASSSDISAGKRLSDTDAKQGDVFLKQLKDEAQSIADDLVNLDKFIRQNLIATQKIIKKFDKRLHFDVAPWLNAQLMDSSPFLKINLDSLLIALSDGYEKISTFQSELKLLQEPPAKTREEVEEGKKGISAQSFERKTTKYWVRSENLMTVKVAISQNLPVYLFDRKTSKPTKNYLTSFDELYGSMADSAAITSIYLDNDDMGVYHSRIKREQSSQLFRLRWYGDAKSLPTKDYVFMERKTHHESWVSEKSVKERFPVKTKHVAAYLDGKFNAAESMAKWMKPDAKGVKLIKNQSELDKAVELSVECQKSIVERKLKPAVRTIYRRAAFQARDNNDVRISIDTQLTLVNEKVQPSPGNEFPWCRDMVNSHIPAHDVLIFPYSILEVKLNTDHPPAWITKLIDDEDMVIECHKFSKFLTGIAYHHYDKVKELPHWFEGQVSIDPRNRFMSPEEKEKLNYADTARYFAAEDHSPKDSDDNIASSSKKLKEDSHTIDVGEDSEDAPLLPRAARAESDSTAHTRNSPNIFMEKASAVMTGLRRRFHGNGGGDPPRNRPMKPIRSINRVKIEPKTSFANERTLIQWISAASLMITLATLIMTSGSELGFKAGLVFFPLAFIIMIYAIGRYQYRAWAFRNRASTYHDDLYGPVVLVIALASAMGVILYLMFYYNSDLPFTAPLDNAAGGCVKLSSNDSYFAYSDVFHDFDGVTWTVGPFVLNRHEGNKTTRFNFPNQQLTAITRPSCKSDFIFLAMERPKKQILVFNMVTNSVVGAIDFARFASFNASLKSMAFVPGKVVPNFDASQSMIAISTEDGSILNFLVPSAQNLCTASSVSREYSMQVLVDTADPTPMEIQLVDMIPSPKLTLGLVDDPFYKHISGLFFDADSNYLFVLFGRSRVMRIFNFSTGKIDREWYLPGTSFQWSGISFSTENQKKFAYLSQSVPGGVWKFDFGASGLDSGQFPGCANVYPEDLIERMAMQTGDKFRRSKMKYVEGY